MRIYRRAGSDFWWCDFGRHKGRRLRVSSGTTDRAEAEAWAKHKQADLWRVERLGDAPTVTWDTAALDWLEGADKRSIETDKMRLRWLTARLGGLPLTAITADRIRALQRDKLSETWQGRPITKATVNRVTALLSRILNHARERGMLAEVPRIERYDEGKGRIRWITREEADTLLAKLPEHLRRMTAFALATGLRQSNVSMLEWRRVDLANRVAWVEADEAKAGKAIPIPLNDDALDALPRKPQGRYVFTYRGKPVAKCTTRAWHEACKRAKVRDFTFHDCRHTWATWHVQNGTPLEVLMKLGGWASYDMVLRYAHLGPQYVAQWAGNVARKRHSGEREPSETGT